jgi:UDP-N-acetylmuramoyl-L-alanyl-D-glutamate--2,6-diaminopimelate ligase
MKLDELLKNVSHLGVRGNRDCQVSGIAYDSRQVRAGFLFVAIPGEHRDGVDFTEDAIRRGANVIVSQQARSSAREATHVQVNSARRALAEAADFFYGHPSARLRVWGVTGTNGKTTITFMLRDILAAAGLNPGLIGTVQYEVGARVIPASRTTPEAPDIQSLLDQMLHTGCGSAVMEVSSHALDQDRVFGLDFDVAVFTNLTRDHLDYHKTMEGYYEAKRKLFLGLGRLAKKPAAVINIDDPYGRRLAADPAIVADILTYGIDHEASVRALDVAYDRQGSTFRIVSPWGESRIRIDLLGRFNVENALAAYTAARANGIDERLVVDVLAKCRTVPGRLEEIPTGRGWRVFVDYAHTDDALANVLKTLRAFTEGRLIVVFGCGGNRDHAKRPLMGRVVADLADLAIVTSDNPRREPPLQIIEEVRAGFNGWTCGEAIEDRATAIATAFGNARDGDVILIAGKGHESTQEFANTIVPFDDRVVARNLLRKEPV